MDPIVTFLLLAALGGIIAYGLGQNLKPEPMVSRFTDEGYRQARWLELHHGGPKAYRWPPPSIYVRPPRPVLLTPGHVRVHKDPYTGEVSVEFR